MTQGTSVRLLQPSREAAWWSSMVGCLGEVTDVYEPTDFAKVRLTRFSDGSPVPADEQKEGWVDPRFIEVVPN